MTLNVVVDELLDGAKRAKGTVVIVDIFRATSQIATLFGVGVKEVYPAINPEEARKIKKELSKKTNEKIYVCGELNGITPPDFDFSNSPYAAYHIFGDELKGKTIVASTTNGTKGILSAKEANEVITASFLNYKAVADYIKQKNPELVTIVGMGEFGASSPEDKRFSYFLRDTIIGQPTYVNRLTEEIYNCSTAQLMREFFGQEINKEIEFCLNTKRDFNVVPKLYKNKLLDAYKQK